MTTAINREEEAITSVQQEINTSTRAIDKLEQEKNELLRSDRIKEIAEKADIEMRDDNIRKIK
jgi:cell division protein FtsL